jgi:hypothetical protein
MIGFSGPIIPSAPAGCQARPSKGGLCHVWVLGKAASFDSPRIARH